MIGKLTCKSLAIANAKLVDTREQLRLAMAVAEAARRHWGHGTVETNVALGDALAALDALDAHRGGR